MATVRIASVDLPTEILQAQQEERLVIFAGAGVSIPPPSSLPTFWWLTKQIEATSGVQMEETEPLDRFLGRVEVEGGNVQKKATAILSHSESRHNVLHERLVRIFPTSSALRIVTTNFDHHFETAIKQHWPNDTIEVYCAPALPNGDDFSGLAYLHGRLHSQSRLVLTDQDFGQAYLTRGWARRFLQDLFSSFTVLFVGYSHDDVVMNYLARGLPPSTQRNRYALIDSKHRRQKWDYLGIEPVVYEWDEAHSRLQEFVQAWDRRSQQGALEREVQIRQTVERDPQALTSAEEDELLYSLSQPSWAQYFFRHANSTEWVNWADSKGVLEPLFDQTAKYEDLADLVDWFCQEPLSNRGVNAARIAELQRVPLHPRLWGTLTHRIWIALKAEKERSKDKSQILASWLSILMHQEPSGSNWFTIINWPQHLLIPQEKEVFLELLRAFTFPRLSSQEGYLPERPVRHEIAIRGSDYRLKEVVSTFQEHLPDLSHPVLLIAIENLEKAHQRLSLLGEATSQSDPTSYLRSRIESQPDGSDHLTHSKPILILVDLAWTAIKWLAGNKTDLLTHITFANLESPSPLVRRICISSIRILPSFSCEEKARLVIGHKWLDYPHKPEAFGLLAQCYPQLATEEREELLNSAEQFYRGDDELAKRENPDAQEYASYNTYNLLVWLAQADPGCKLVQERLKKIQNEHPEYEPREYPDLDHWSGGISSISAVSPYSSDEIVTWAPGEYLERLDAVMKEPRKIFSEDPVRGFLEQTAEAVVKSPEMGIAIGEELANRQAWESTVWHYIFRGWLKSTTEEAAFISVLSFLSGRIELSVPALADDVSDLIEERSKNRQQLLSRGAIITCTALALRVLDYTRDELFDEGETNQDWLQRAINRPSGKIAEFALHGIDTLWAEDNKPNDWSIPEPLRSLCDRLVKEFPFGQTVLASHLHFLLAADTAWSRDNLLPLFSWPTNGDAESTTQVWSGFLDWGRPTSLVREYLLPHLKETFRNLNRLHDRQRNRLPAYVAWLAYGDDKDPLPWLREFIIRSSDEDRASFAEQIGHVLEDLKPEQREELWKNWLGEYFHERMDGPPQMGTKEKLGLVWWCDKFSEKLPELARSLTELDPPDVEFYQLYNIVREDEEDPIPTTDSFGELLLWILKGQRKDRFAGFPCEQVRTVLEKLRGRIDAGLYKQLVVRYSELGCIRASELMET